MTSGLRKVHRYIWLILIIAVPVLIVFSIKDLDPFASKSETAVIFETTTSNVLKTSENELIKASLLEKDSIHFVEIILKSPLKHPSSLVYALDDGNKKGTLLGQLTTVGIYRFKIPNASKGVIVFDALKETFITKLIF